MFSQKIIVKIINNNKMKQTYSSKKIMLKICLEIVFNRDSVLYKQENTFHFIDPYIFLISKNVFVFSDKNKSFFRKVDIHSQY